VGKREKKLRGWLIVRKSGIGQNLGAEKQGESGVPEKHRCAGDRQGQKREACGKGCMTEKGRKRKTEGVSHTSTETNGVLGPAYEAKRKGGGAAAPASGKLSTGGFVSFRGGKSRGPYPNHLEDE